MRELNVVGIFFSKNDWLPFQSLLLWQTLLRDELYSIMRLEFIYVPLLGTPARTGQMRTSRDCGYLSSYHWRRDVLIYPRPRLTGRDFQSRSTCWNPVPRVLSQGVGSDESFDLIFQMPTIISIVANVVVETAKLGGVSLPLLVL